MFLKGSIVKNLYRRKINVNFIKYCCCLLVSYNGTQEKDPPYVNNFSGQVNNALLQPELQ